MVSVHDVEKENDVQVMNDRCLPIWYDLLAARTFGRREGIHQLAPKQASMVQSSLSRSAKVPASTGTSGKGCISLHSKPARMR